jgi:Skp family chaperone for outer membrane proteins
MRTVGRVLIAVMMLFAAAGAHAQIPLRVACFSPQRVFSESSDGKAALARLTTIQNSKTRAIDEKNRALRAQELALEQSSSLLSEDARTERTNEVQKLRIDVQRFIEDAQAELLGIQREAENAFVVKLKPALAKVAQDKGLQLILSVDDGQVAWFDPTLDLTSDVVKQLALK